MAGNDQAPQWMLIAGVIFLAVSLIFFMGLVLIAVLLGKEVPADSKFLVVVIFSITTAVGSAFIGGYAKASGKISLPFFKDPLTFGTTGGIAVLILVLVFGHLLYSGEKETSGHLTNRIELLETTIKTITANIDSAPSSAPGRRELESIKSEFKSAIETAKKSHESAVQEAIDVAIIVGHSEARPGGKADFHGKSISEFSFNLEFAPKLKYSLQQIGVESRIFFRKANDIRSPYLQAALHQPRLIVALHSNSGPKRARGSEALVRQNDYSSKTIAEGILSRIAEKVGIPKRKVRPVKPGDRGSTALYATNRPAIIILPFFITNPDDMATAMEHEQKLASSIAEAIASSIKS